MWPGLLTSSWVHTVGESLGQNVTLGSDTRPSRAGGGPAVKVPLPQRKLLHSCLLGRSDGQLLHSVHSTVAVLEAHELLCGKGARTLKYSPSAGDI